MRPDLAAGLEVLADVLSGATFPQDALERERAAQIAGIRAENDDPLSTASRALRRELFAGHPYAELRNGRVETVSALGRDDLFDFQRRYLTGGNLVLSLYGDVDVSEARERAAQIAKMLPAGARAFESIPEPRFQPGPREVEIVVDKQQAVIVAGFPGLSMYHPARLVAHLIEEACSDMASRLFIRIREEHGLAYFVSAAHFSALAGGMLSFYLGTSLERAKQAEDLLRTELEALRQEGLTERELERARRTYLGKMRLRVESSGGLGMTEGLNELYGLGYGFHREEEERVRALTIEEVRETAGHLLAEENAVWVRVLPGGGDLPEESSSGAAAGARRDAKG
jgi:zinc protease